MLFHASQVVGIKELIPHISNHGVPRVYLSSKRENVLVYLSNAVEKVCRECGYRSIKGFTKWASYGFENGLLSLDEYYPNATADTYKGVSGYIYSIDECTGFTKQEDVPFAFVSQTPCKVIDCEFVPDAYQALLKARDQNKIIINSFERNSQRMLDWIEKTVIDEYLASSNKDEYSFF